VVNALARAGVELGENGSVIPRSQPGSADAGLGCQSGANS